MTCLVLLEDKLLMRIYSKDKTQSHKIGNRLGSYYFLFLERHK